MGAVSTKITPQNSEETAKVFAIQSSHPDEDTDNGAVLERLGIKTLDTARDLTEDALDVSDDMRVVLSLVPRDGYDRRNDLIFGAEDLTTEQKLTESYRNDRHYAAAVEKAGDVTSRMRDKKSKNLGKILGAGVISIVAVCAFIMGNSDTRAKIFKWVAEKAA